MIKRILFTYVSVLLFNEYISLPGQTFNKNDVITTEKIKSEISYNNNNNNKTTSNFSSLWSKFPKNLQDKAQILPKDCGLDVENRILFGKNANLGQFPWMALIGYDDKGVQEFWCGGTVISKRYILTAAHCINTKKNYHIIKPNIVRLGEWNLTSDIDCEFIGIDEKECAPPVVQINIEENIVHENYGNITLPSLRNDIALIRLAEDIKFNYYISPICLHPEIPSNTTDLYIAGWGLTESSNGALNPVLQFAQISLFNFEECNTIIPSEVSPLDKTQFCAMGDKAETACKGDSGGPVKYLSPTNGNYYQKGIVSFSASTRRECDDVEGKPVIYTEVSEFMEWILNTIR